MKIGYLGDGPWAHEAFKRIIEDSSIEIKFVTVRFDKQDSILIQLATQNKIPIELNENINSQEFIRKVGEYDVDLLVSMSFNQIFSSTLINLPKYKTINCHAGKLPFYRGRNILNWALILMMKRSLESLFIILMKVLILEILFCRIHILLQTMMIMVLF